ncbi:nucleolin protein [Pseudozyma hubeiensis SY62]|uniref:Nucleolin protein n=1 Tax=Pseudozyma hubeiensis (strain SY62) TaxID=1305764 RepID=R9NZQ9_PSEHS|nr:nucleolin protein [Pseudozyma hubeiensis SY62]GAC94291.1 nucleolin protein [Pseudozyma hubeiensis SY62]
MALNDFLADETTGKTSWADEMDDLPISSAPRDSSYRRGGDFLSSVPDRVDRDRAYAADRGFDRPERSYPPREELPLPDKPPFTAFVGNLSFDVMEADVEDFFAPSKTVSVRIVTGHDGKPKGFGYVEFQSQDDLRAALDRSGAQIAGRTVRISVAEPPKSAFGGDRSFQASQADDASQWRRAGPLPPSEPRGGFAPRPERSGVPRTEGSGFDNMDVSAGVRSGFGAKFQSAPPSARPPRDLAPVEPSQGDLASQWRTGKPVEGRSPASSRRPSGMADSDSRRSSFRQRNDANDVDDRFASQERMGFGSKFTPDQTPPESPANAKKGFGFGAAERRTGAQSGSAPGAASDSTENWRTAKKPSSGSSSPAPSAAAPAERKKLDLKPRSAESAATAAASTNSSKPSPFGNAKPIDASERERQIEEKLSQREKERQEELKAKKEKAKAEKEAKEKATAATATDSSKPEAAEAASPAAASTSPAAAKAPRAAAPTGAWGGGRKPSGALVGGEQDEADASDANGQETTEAQVDEVAEKVQETKLEA